MAASRQVISQAEGVKPRSSATVPLLTWGMYRPWVSSISRAAAIRSPCAIGALVGAKSLGRASPSLR